MKFSLKEDAKKLFFVTTAALIMAININTFVHAGNLLPGGATGLTLLLQKIFRTYLHINLPYTLINVLLNAIPVYIGFRYIGTKFTLYSCLMILLTGLFTDMLPYYTITSDVLLVCIFGGIINGFAISLCLFADTTSGGTDFIAIFLSERYGIESFNYIFGFNVCILIVAGYLFGWDKSLYSIIFQFTSTQIIHMLYKRYKKQTLFIITDHPEDIYTMIGAITNHGATIFRGEGSFEHKERSMVYSVVSSEEIKKVLSEVRRIDPCAFVNVIKTEQVTGRFYLRPTR